MNIYVKLLRNINFRRFILSLALLNIGRKLSWVALGWFVYEITGSPAAIGTVIAASTITPLISSILAGGLLDSYNRKVIMIAENLIRGLVLATIPLLFWINSLTLTFVIVVICIDGLLSSFTTIGASSILPSFIEKGDLEAGNAVISMNGQAGSLLGPALGGICAGLFGAPVTLMLNVSCFLLASFLYFLIPSHVYNKNTQIKNNKHYQFNQKLNRYFTDTINGFKYILRFRILIFIALITFFFNLSYAPLESILPVYVSTILDQGPEVLGLMWTCFAVGSFIGSLIWVRLSLKFNYSSTMGAIICLWGCVPFVLSILNQYEIVYLFMFLGGLVYSPYNIVAPTLRQKLVPNELRGRVFGVYSLISGLGFPLGLFIGGIIGENFGVIHAIVASGMMTVALGVIVFVLPTLKFHEIAPLKQDHQEKALKQIN